MECHINLCNVEKYYAYWQKNQGYKYFFQFFLLFMVGVFYILALHFHFFIDSFQKKGYMKKCTSINAAFSYHIQ